MILLSELLAEAPRKSLNLKPKKTTVEEDIADAISRKIKIRFFYTGDDKLGRGWRTVRPHALGVGKNGTTYLRAYQDSGTSASGNTPPWRLFIVDKIQKLDKSLMKFKPAMGYNKSGDKAMTKIIAKI